MAKVYVNSKQECPRDAVLREGPQGRLYYRPEERGSGAEVGGVMDSFDELFSTFYKRRVYVSSPAEVPPEFEPQRGGQGGWFYETIDSSDAQEDSQVLEQLVDMIVEQIIPELAEDDYYSEEVAPSVYETVRDRVQLSDDEVTEQRFKSIVVNTVEETMPEEKTELDRVYVGDESQVPESYEAQEDERGDMYYVRTDDQFIDSGRETTSYDFDKQEEVTEGLTWNEHVMVVDVDREEGMATLVDTEGSSEWEEPLESVEAKLEQLEANEDHEWMYELVAGEYPSLEAEDVMEMVHDAAGIDKGVRPDWEERLDKDEDPCWEGYTMVGLKDNGNPRCVPDDDVENYDADKSQKSRVYVGDESEVPDEYTPQTSERGAVYYETDDGGSNGGGVPSEVEDMGLGEEFAEGDAQTRSDVMFDVMEEEGTLDELEEEVEMGEDPEDAANTVLDYFEADGEERDILEDQLVTYLEQGQEEDGI